ncbi:MAG: YoaP domain-containing protein [Lachnospiraceae bacterium]|jgi:N-acetylglutamate synthase-like GNAT family acetyltransferase|nr:YoaP domain-containing protein [Lachnospiraceae bacterium]
MGYIRITEENIGKEHICCAMSNNQSLQKKEWLKARFKEGLVFYRSEERGKCFIEYMPAETAWQPLEADGYIHINCLWVSGSLKGHGYSSDLLDECVRDAKEQRKKGLCILSSAKKKGFLADPKYLKHKGFQVADESDTGIQLWYLPFENNTDAPRFKECAKHPLVTDPGFVIYYSDQCPFTYYWVPRLEKAAEENGIPLKVIHIDSREAAQNAPSPVTNFSIFRDGKFLSHEIQSEKKLLKLAGL